MEKMPSKENKDNVSSSDYVTVYSENYDDITKVSIENSEGGFVIVKNDKGWFSTDNDKIELGSDKVDSLLMSVSTVVGNVIDENPKTLTITDFPHRLQKLSTSFPTEKDKLYSRQHGCHRLRLLYEDGRFRHGLSYTGI